MASASQHSGLCSSCLNRVVCTYRRSPERPVLDCDEYEAAPGTLSLPSRPTQSEPAASSRSHGDCHVHLGLCKTCAQRENCDFSKPEAGVWHCEEYC